MHTHEGVAYEIDARDRIVYVNDAWNHFAHANDGAELARDEVLNRSLWDFVSDPTTRELYRQVITRIRAGYEIKFNFRCDSPGCTRLLEMDVRPLGSHVRFETRTIEVEPREDVALLDRRQPRSPAAVRMCAWCTRILAGDTWITFDEGIARLGLLEAAAVPQLTHGICPECYSQMQAMITT